MNVCDAPSFMGAENPDTPTVTSGPSGVIWYCPNNPKKFEGLKFEPARPSPLATKTKLRLQDTFSSLIFFSVQLAGWETAR